MIIFFFTLKKNNFFTFKINEIHLNENLDKSVDIITDLDMHIDLDVGIMLLCVLRRELCEK